MGAGVTRAGGQSPAPGTWQTLSNALYVSQCRGGKCGLGLCGKERGGAPSLKSALWLPWAAVLGTAVASRTAPPEPPVPEGMTPPITVRHCSCPGEAGPCLGTLGQTGRATVGCVQDTLVSSVLRWPELWPWSQAVLSGSGCSVSSQFRDEARKASPGEAAGSPVGVPCAHRLGLGSGSIPGAGQTWEWSTVLRLPHWWPQGWLWLQPGAVVCKFGWQWGRLPGTHPVSEHLAGNLRL